MKTKAIFILFLFFVTNLSFSNTIFSVQLAKAEAFKKEQKFTKAINCYLKAIRSVQNDDAMVKEVYFDIADCFYKSGKVNMAVKVLKFSIYRFGAVKQDLLDTNKLDDQLVHSLFEVIGDKYDSYRNKYVSKFDKKEKLLAEVASETKTS